MNDKKSNRWKYGVIIWILLYTFAGIAMVIIAVNNPPTAVSRVDE